MLHRFRTYLGENVVRENEYLSAMMPEVRLGSGQQYAGEMRVVVSRFGAERDKRCSRFWRFQSSSLKARQLARSSPA